MAQDPRTGFTSGSDSGEVLTPADQVAGLGGGGFGEPFIDLELVLFWIGMALIATYAVNALATVLPARLFEPEWISRACTILRGAASFPLEGMVLILLSAYLPRPAKEPRRISRLRRFCIWAALGFLLMIPLQSWAGLKLIDQSVEAQKQILAPSQNALRKIYAATSPETLLAAIRSIPGAPPTLQGRFDEPFQKVRDQIIRQMEPEIRKNEALLEKTVDSIRSGGHVGLIRDGAIALFNAVAFAAIGRSRPSRPSLLRLILQPGSTFNRVPDDVERWLEDEPKV